MKVPERRASEAKTGRRRAKVIHVLLISTCQRRHRRSLSCVLSLFAILGDDDDDDREGTKLLPVEN